jgi:hypothetical protein
MAVIRFFKHDPGHKFFQVIRVVGNTNPAAAWPSLVKHVVDPMNYRVAIFYDSDVLKKMPELTDDALKALDGKMVDSWVRDEGSVLWYPAYGRTTTLETLVQVHASTTTDTPGPRKPIPALPAEVWNTTRFNPEDAMAAVRAACKGA